MSKETKNSPDSEKKQSGLHKFQKWYLKILLGLFIAFVFALLYLTLVHEHTITQCPNCENSLQIHSNPGSTSPGEEYTGIALGICSVLATIVIGLNIFSYIDFKGLKEDVKENESNLKETFKELKGDVREDVINLKMNLEEKSSGLESKIKQIDTDVVGITKANLENMKRTLSEQCRSDADHSRMTAFHLKESGKPIWAIGWISRAVKRYFQCCATSDKGLGENSYNPITQSCHFILMDSINKFVEKVNKNEDIKFDSTKSFLATYGKENDEDVIEIFKRTLKDFADYLLILDEENIKNVKDIHIEKEDKIKWLVFNLKLISKENNDEEIMSSFMQFLIKLIDDREVFNKCAEDSYFSNVIFSKHIQKNSEKAKDKNLENIFSELTANGKLRVK